LHSLKRQGVIYNHEKDIISDYKKLSAAHKLVEDKKAAFQDLLMIRNLEEFKQFDI
jgi:hypothetical protein